MKNIKQIGVYLDHSEAFLIEHNNITITNGSIESKFTHQQKEFTLSKSEHLMHNKEQQQQGEYFKKIAAAIKMYDKVLLFGPTNAKDELNNLLKADHHFDKITIEVQQSDKLTENQQHALVRNHFHTH